jgi:hypothetical protein
MNYNQINSKKNTLKKVALLLSGQMRTFDYSQVLEKLNIFIEKYNCDVFISTWHERGISVSSHISDEEKHEINGSLITRDNLNVIKNLKSVEIHNYENFLKNIEDQNIKNLLNQNNASKNYSKITSYPQFFKRYCVNNLKNNYKKINNINYDVVIATRPDILFVHNDIDQYFYNITNTLYHINTGVSYHPNRVYDIFLFSDEEVMDKICDCWTSYYECKNYPTDCILTEYDACKLLYAQCIKYNIKILSIDRVLGDVARPESFLDYESFEKYYL